MCAVHVCESKDHDGVSLLDWLDIAGTKQLSQAYTGHILRLISQTYRGHILHLIYVWIDVWNRYIRDNNTVIPDTESSESEHTISVVIIMLQKYSYVYLVIGNMVLFLKYIIGSLRICFGDYCCGRIEISIIFLVTGLVVHILI